VNAAGAWADVFAQMAGVTPIGLQPRRRTVISFAAPESEDVRAWPFTKTVGEGFYLLPEGRGQLLASSMDQTPSEPCDAAAEELDIAIAADRVEQATILPIRRISHSWAGLRSFVADELPVIGEAAGAPGFIWCAGQGGAGFQTAPALSAIAAAATLGLAFPPDAAAAGLSFESFSPGRLGG
jgi:D-arginine dehydrogenase